MKYAIAAATITCIVALSTTADGAHGPERPKTHTPITGAQLVDVLRNAHVSEFGKRPTRQRLSMAWAQVALENDHGKAVWNHNLGNIGPAPSMSVAWYNHSQGVKYRAFNDANDAGRAYWRVINRCGSALQAFDDGYPRGASEGLKRCGYYTADVNGYIDAMSTLYSQAIAHIVPESESRERKLNDNEHEARERIELELRFPYTPTCGCSLWF